MADEKSLQFIGFGLGAITAAVMLIAAIVITTIDRGPGDRPQLATMAASPT